ESGVAGMEDVSRGVVDVYNDCVEELLRSRGVEAGIVGHHGEEVAMYELASWVCGDASDLWKKLQFVPVDHLAERFHHHQRAHAGVLEDCTCSVAKTKASDDDVEVVAS